MTREHWKSVLPFVRAFADGKPVECKSGNAWIVMRASDLNDFAGSACNYRIVEPPKLRPWKLEEVPLGDVIRHKKWSNGCVKLITGRVASNAIVNIEYGGNWISSDTAFMEWDTSSDGGKTWLPCGVEE